MQRDLNKTGVEDYFRTVVESHKDVTSAADDIGEVLLVMRVGGRHRHWGDPGKELAAYEE